ncbi:hypothetical protein TrVGV298_006927 [Trichoderma virens]|nr:hypothetical protein TrVGV298_006927 [Trichoderma virens]
MGDMGYTFGGQEQFDKEAQELYTSLVTVLVDSRGPDTSLKLPLLRSATSLRVSGEVTLAMIMFASCWFFEYDPSSIPLVVEIWRAWLPSRQTDAELCVEPAKHIYVGTGPHDARNELSKHNGRAVVNFSLRLLVPRARRHATLDIAAFRDIMAFRSGMLVADCLSRDNRDIGAFIQVAGQFPALIDPSEAEDIWSGQSILDLGRTVLFIRQVKHLTICLATPRSMGILFAFFCWWKLLSKKGWMLRLGSKTLTTVYAFAMSGLLEYNTISGHMTLLVLLGKWPHCVFGF